MSHPCSSSTHFLNISTVRFGSPFLYALRLTYSLAPLQNSSSLIRLWAFLIVFPRFDSNIPSSNYHPCQRNTPTTSAAFWDVDIMPSPHSSTAVLNILKAMALLTLGGVSRSTYSSKYLLHFEMILGSRFRSLCRVFTGLVRFSSAWFLLCCYQVDCLLLGVV